MRIAGLGGPPGLLAIALTASVSGCGPDKITLQEAPPAKIADAKTSEATKDRAALKAGAPPKGSSAGMNHNPSETP